MDDEVAPGREAGPGVVPVLSVPEIRDYQRINAELTVLLDAGHRLIRLVGVERQRLLVAGLRGRWDAVVEVEGDAGPELAAGLDAPGLTVVCRGRADDGAGSMLRAGRLIIVGAAGAAAGYAMRGGAVVVAGDAGPRAGLKQSGGVLVLLGDVERLAGDRQSGGILVARANRLGPHSGRGRLGGRFLILLPGVPPESADSALLNNAVGSWIALDLGGPAR